MTSIKLFQSENLSGDFASVAKRFMMQQAFLQSGGDPNETNHLVNLDSQGYDWYKQISGDIEPVARETSQFVQSVIDMGNVTPINFGTTLAGYQYRGDTVEPGVSINPQANVSDDRQRYEWEWLPIPIVHTEFSVGIVEEASAAMNGHSQSDDMIFDNTENMMIKLDELAIKGGFRANNAEQNASELYGALNHPQRQQYTTLTTGAWNGTRVPGANDLDNGEVIVNEILAMEQLLVNKNIRGQRKLLIPKNFVTNLSSDFTRQKGNSGDTILERIMKIPGLNYEGSVQQVDQIPSDEVLLVSTNRKFVDVAVGADLTIAPYTLDPYNTHYCMFTKIAVRWKKIHDVEGNSKTATTTGIVHGH